MKKSFIKMLFQVPMDAIKNWNPRRLKIFLGTIQDIFVGILLQISEETIKAIKFKIIEVSKEDIPSWPDKFKKVRDWVLAELNLSHLAKTFIDLLIQALVSQLKKDKTIA